jgi:hypothetical protein
MAPVTFPWMLASTLVLVAMFVAAPAGASGPASALAAAPASPTAHAAPDSRGVEADSTVLVRVERMGGFAGVHESWTLHASGKVWFLPAPGVEASLLRTVGSELMEQVRGVMAAGLGRQPGGVPGVECSDCFFYRVVGLGPGTSGDVLVGEHRLAEASPELRRLVGLVTGHGPPPLSLPGGGTQSRES